MTDPEQKLTPATPDDLAQSLSFALRFEGRKSHHDSDRLNADIVAKRLVRHLEKAGYVVMKRPPLEGHEQVARGFGQK
jgi:predicted glycosyltransferase